MQRRGLGNGDWALGGTGGFAGFQSAFRNPKSAIEMPRPRLHLSLPFRPLPIASRFSFEMPQLLV